MIPRFIVLSFFIFHWGLVSVLGETLHQYETTIDEIPYYLRQLEKTEIEGERLKFNKIIHDAVVNADLSKKKVVKKLEPLIEQIRIATDSGLDRPNISGKAMWLASSLDYFEREKLKPLVQIPKDLWMENQTQSLTGVRLSPYPDKIIVHENDESYPILQSQGIHEAIVSPDGRRLAFFRRVKEGSEASEIWRIDRKTKESKKILTLPSCHTILFSERGKYIFYQEKPKTPGLESNIYRINWKGRGKKWVTKGVRLETMVKVGPYKGALIIFKKTLHHLGVANQDCAYAYSSSGRELGRLRGGPCH